MKDSLLAQQVAQFLGLDAQTTHKLARMAPNRYKKYSVIKKNGLGKRTILHPSKETKAIQYALLHILFNKIPIHENAYAYKKGLSSPLRRNAEKHCSLPFSIRIDFKDFFPSLRPEDLYSALPERGIQSLTNDDKLFLKSTLFFQYFGSYYGLPIGAPTSPAISNIILFKFDDYFSKAALSINSDATYSRYADDIVFSSNKKGDCRKFLDISSDIINTSQSPKLIINDKKTIFLSKKYKRTITGLTITTDGNVSIGRARKRYIKKLIYDYFNSKLSPGQIGYLRGILAFALDNEPSFYNRLIVKYGYMVNNIVKQK